MVASAAKPVVGRKLANRVIAQMQRKIFLT
jgi:hypothetical protein